MNHEKASDNPIRRRPTVGPLPLSFAQQRLWFLDQWNPGSALYHIHRVLRITGRLDLEALRKSLDSIVARHEILRTTFAAVDGTPLQVIAPARAVDLSLVDLTGKPKAERWPESQRFIHEEALRPFDLTADLMLRAALVRLGEEEHILLLTMHHIASDGWSTAVFVREISTLYKAFSNGEGETLPELPIQYADFAVWQREWLQGAPLDSQLGYWKNQLAGVSPLLELPTDRPRPAMQTFRGGRQSLQLPRDIADGLKQLSRRERVTLFMTLLAAFQTLLHRYSGQDDILVGSPIANRTRVEIEGLIGFFVNTLVFRATFSPDQTFQRLLRQLRQTCFDAYTHQDLPFEKLVEELHPDRDLRRNPLFQVMFQFRNLPQQVWTLGNLTVQDCPLEIGLAKFDLTLDVQENGAGMLCTCGYNSDLFDDRRIERMLGHYRKLLEGIVADPERRLSRLPLLTDSERQELLVQWNDTQKAYSKNSTLHELFEDQVQQTPGITAAVFEDSQLTYAELNIRANQLANYLRVRGVGPEMFVGICLERSLEMLVGVLGILKAGAAYVPIDPNYPRERLDFILEDTQASLVLTQNRFAEALMATKSTIMCMDADWDVIARESGDNPVITATPGNLAYVLYTSGSTGRPKGVLIEHRQIVNYVNGVRDRCTMGSGAAFAMVQPLSVDSSQTVIFPALLSGGCLHIIHEDKIADAAALSDYFTRAGIDILKIAPSHLAALQNSAAPDRLLPRRRLIIGGEASRRDWFDELRSLGRDCTVFNHYGPTETTVGVLTYHAGTRHNEINSTTAPIGRPLPNIRAYLLDRDMQPVPPGVVGELHIGGHGVARGYLQRPEATAEKFIPNPFDDEPGTRLYRTGDLARYLPDGNIEFLGRTDHQVKIRGFRIELGEIETALRRHPDVREALVLAQEDPSARLGSAKRLVAYLVPHGQISLSVTDLRGYLRQTLPEYMVPGAFMLLDNIPRTPQGKTDYRALPTPDQARPELAETLVPPRTPTEQTLAAIWSRVLGIEPIGVSDNFFDLGGHSLMATQIVSRVRDAFHVEITLRSLFETPDIAGLARNIEALAGQNEPTAGSVRPAAPGSEEWPLSFAQERLWFLQQLAPTSSTYNTPRSFRLKGPVDVSALQRAFDEIVRRHEVLRTNFSIVGGRPTQFVREHRPFELQATSAVGSDAEREAELVRLFEREVHRPFDLAQDLMLRATLVQLSDNEHVLIVVYHHIASDHWSVAVLFDELSALYDSFSTGRVSPLMELPFQYRHFARSERQRLQGPRLEKEISYWRRQLSALPPPLQLPTDYPRAALQTFRGGRVSSAVPKEVVNALIALSQAQKATSFMTLLAVFQLLLHRLTGQEDIAVGSPVSARSQTESEKLIGCFLNSMVLRSDLSGNPSFIQLLARIRQMALDAYDHQDFPFEKLLIELQPKRDLSRTPLFQVLFNMYNFKEAQLQLRGIESRVDSRLSRLVSLFDLTLYVREHEDGLRLNLVYNADLFSKERMAELLEQYKLLLAQIVEQPDKSIADFSLETPTSQKVLPDPTLPLHRAWKGSVAARFSQQAQRVSKQPAILDRGEVWNYDELDGSSNALAHCLVSKGVRPGEIVAVYGDRNAALVVALLGILKAGGVFTILDPGYPARRLVDQVQVAGPRAWIVVGGGAVPSSDLEDAFSTSMCRCRLVLPDTKEGIRNGELKNYSAGSLDFSSAPDDPAYVAFTSGTSGRQRAVLGTHRPLSHFLQWHCRTFDLKESDRFSMLSGLSHDPLLRDIFTPLCLGATLCVPQADDVSPTRLADWFDRNEITATHLTPATAELLALESLPQDRPTPRLRYVFFGGDVLPRQGVRRLRKFAPSAIYVNFYGATETPQAMGYQIVDDEPASASGQEQGIVTLGRGIEGVQLLVLTSGGQHAGIGELGEIHVRTPYLAEGYLGDAALTRERFIPNPFTSESGDRLYRTGDLGRYLPDGTVIIAGRSDRQIKIRGFRIEPGEIEAVLSGHPEVRAAVVVPFEDARGDRKAHLTAPKRLVAYVVPATNRPPSSATLRSFLRERLPDYMVPSAVILLDALPLTPNGKLDTKALPLPDESRPEQEVPFAVPHTPVETAIAEIWAKILKVDRPGVNDNFFDLGGHSLLATQIISHLRDAFSVELPLRSLFESPTIGALAATIEAARENGSQSDTTKISAVPREARRVQVAQKSTPVPGTPD